MNWYADWDEKCKICGTEMKHIKEDCHQCSRGCDQIYWCPKCGTLLDFYDSWIPDEKDWHIPEKEKS